MAVTIMTDSASDISQEVAKKWGIVVLPLLVRFGEDEYLDGVTLSPYQFYEKLIETDEIPKTSQITPFDFGEAFRKEVEAGNDVVMFTLSSGVSGSYQSACIAAEDYPGKVFVVDSKQFCVSEYIIVERAVELRDAGKSAAEIATIMEEEKKEAHVIAIFDTLEYLKLGGRISSAAAFAGTMLNLKPVLTIEEGVVKILGKARGSRNGNNMLTEWANKLGIDYDRPVCFAYSGFDDTMLQKYIHDQKDLYEGHLQELQIAEVGATIGTYAGPGAIAVAFFETRK